MPPSSKSWIATSLCPIAHPVRNRSGAHDATILIWPESAFPFFLAREPDALAQITQLLRRAHCADYRRGAAGRTGQSPPNPTVYNSIYVIDHDGSIVSIYDKVHLVPFGEYLPFQHLLESLGLQQLTKQPGGFSAGDRRRLIAVPGRPAGAAADLLRDYFSGRTDAQRPTARLDGQCHQ